MFSRSLVTAAIVCLSVSPAYAEPSAEELKKAGALFEEAEKKFKIGEYQLALADYKTAYLLTGEPALLFNIGQCHRFLKNDPEAIKSYKTFLRDANPDANQKALAEKLIAEIEAKGPIEQSATLEARAVSGAEGAILFIDGAASGTLPVSLSLKTGAHNIELRRDNIILYTEAIELKPGETLSLSISLTKEPPKAEGVLLRFTTPLENRSFDIELLTGSSERLVCADPVTPSSPCELRVLAEKAKVKIGNCSDSGVFCTPFTTANVALPLTDSVMSFTTPRAPRLGRTLLVLGIPVGVVGLIMRVSSPFDPFGPVNPNPLAPPQPGERRFFVGGNMLIAGAVLSVVGGGLTIARRQAIKKYYQSNPSFVPLPSAL